MTTQIKWPLVLRTKRLVLRPYLSNDYDAWTEGFRQRRPPKDVFDEGPPALSTLKRSDFAAMRRRHRRRAMRDTAYVWGIFKKSGECIGWVDLFVFDRGETQSANFGYLLHNSYWGQGLGREAAHVMALAAFRKLKLHRLEATIHTRNRRSIKLIRALGFRAEGKRLKSGWNGKNWYDEFVYAATPDDFGLPIKAPRVRRSF